LHIGTHIFSETSKDNTQNPVQTRYQLTNHLQSNTLELDDKAVAFLLHLSFVFASDDGSATIGVVMFVTKGLSFVI
jgi:hypothetical protein